MSRCQEDESVELVLKKDSQSDLYAIEVCRRNGDQLGYLEPSCAVVVKEKLRRGRKISAVATRIHNSSAEISRPRYTIDVRIDVLD